MTTASPVIPTVANTDPGKIVHALHMAQMTYATVIANIILANPNLQVGDTRIGQIQFAEQMLAAIDLALPVFEGEL